MAWVSCLPLPLLGIGMLGYCVGVTLFLLGLLTPTWSVFTFFSKGRSQDSSQHLHLERAAQYLIIVATVLAFVSTYVCLAILIQSCKGTLTDKKAAIASFVFAVVSGLIGLTGSIVYPSSMTNNTDPHSKSALNNTFSLCLAASLFMLISAGFVLAVTFKVVNFNRAQQGQGTAIDQASTNPA